MTTNKARNVTRSNVAYVITEGISSTQHFHWSRPDERWESLCGARTMPTSMRANGWGFITRLKERYCEECGSLRRAELVR